MVMLRTVMWPATVVTYQKVDDTSPSAMAMRNVKVDVFKKGERVVRAKDLYPFPPKADYHSKKPKAWQEAMQIASSANGDIV